TSITVLQEEAATRGLDDDVLSQLTNIVDTDLRLCDCELVDRKVINMYYNILFYTFHFEIYLFHFVNYIVNPFDRTSLLQHINILKCQRNNIH
ncbi:hypothetical protein X777_11068, partial [Ooceraea biroi]